MAQILQVIDESTKTEGARGQAGLRTAHGLSYGSCAGRIVSLPGTQTSPSLWLYQKIPPGKDRHKP